MKRFRDPRNRTAIHGTLFCIFLFLYTWPLLTSFGQGFPDMLFIYYYAVLALHTVVMVLLAGNAGATYLEKEEGLKGADRKW